MADQHATLDGMGLLAAVQPAPLSFALLRARVQTDLGIAEQHVLALVTATGAHVTYWSREALTQLRDKLNDELGGLQVASTLPTSSPATTQSL